MSIQTESPVSGDLLQKGIRRRPIETINILDYEDSLEDEISPIINDNPEENITFNRRRQFELDEPVQTDNSAPLILEQPLIVPSHEAIDLTEHKKITQQDNESASAISLELADKELHIKPIMEDIQITSIAPTATSAIPSAQNPEQPMPVQTADVRTNQNSARSNVKVIKTIVKTTRSNTRNAMQSPRPVHKQMPVPSTGIFARLRNSLIGMALAYIGRLELVTNPVVFVFKNIIPLFLGAVHVITPMAILWFASHWNINVEQQFWGQGFFINSIQLACLFIVSSFIWTTLYLTAVGLLRTIGNNLMKFSETGEEYLKQSNKSS